MADNETKQATSTGVNFSVKDYSKDVLVALDAQIYKGLITCGILAEGFAKKLCPVDTGRLRNSITYSVKTQTANMGYKWGKGKKTKRPAGDDETVSHGGEEEHTLYLGTNVEYAIPVEFGTGRRKADPYIRPAIDDHLDEYKMVLQKTLKGH